jgi:hexosaminidase
LTTIHIGGDEVPAGTWERSPACRRFLAENPDVDNLFAYFVERVRHMLESKGLATAGWEEIGLKDHAPNPTLAGRVVPYLWNNLGENQDLAPRLARAGYDVVLCNVTHLYFDLAYDKDPEEPGFYWGGFVDTRKVFELIPDRGFESEIQSRILGIQGQLWSETLRRPDMMEYYLVPKLLGLAERAWAPPPRWVGIEDEAEREAAISSSWNVVANTIGQREMPRLDNLFGGVGYRIPPPGAVIENGLLKANVAFPGLTLRYSVDGTEPSASSMLYGGPVAVSGPVKIKAFDSRGQSSRTVEPKSSFPEK